MLSPWFLTAATVVTPVPVSLRGTAEIEFVDVQGAGGTSNLESGTIRPERRAAYVNLDKATLEFGMHLRPWLLGHLELRANEQGARADRLYLDATVVEGDQGRLVLQVGRQKPMQRPRERRTETYSPLGVVFWRGREWHAGAHATLTLGAVEVEAVPSVAMQRDLGDDSMGEDPRLPTTVYSDTALREGSAAEMGFLIGARAEGAYVAGFGFRGSLLDNEGPDRLDRTFQDDYETLGDKGDRTNLWGGGRAGYDGYGVHFMTEGIVNRIGLLKRRGFEVGASYTFGFHWLGEPREVEPLLRYGQITLTNLPEQFQTPESWDREQWVAALLLRPLDVVEVKIEYLFLRERTGVSAEGTSGVRDDQLLVQLKLDAPLL